MRRRGFIPVSEAAPQTLEFTRDAVLAQPRDDSSQLAADSLGSDCATAVLRLLLDLHAEPVEHPADLVDFLCDRLESRVWKVAEILAAQEQVVGLAQRAFRYVEGPIFQRLDPQLPEDAPGPLRRAWKACETEIDKVVTEARLAA